ncbi:MAG: hypothetical protein QGH83_09100 [Candidatus Pacebacteria bacterium]|nr:hypothetical protein [Candidatus Paceibacterota bacterium]
MANTIQIKRSSASSAPAALGKGELAWVDHGTGGAAGILYVGDMTAAGAVVRTIGGPGWAAPLASPALTGNPTAPTQASSDNSTRLATTAYVTTATAAMVTTVSGLTDTVISAPAGGHVLIYDGTNSWDNKALSGDVSISAAGVTAVNGVAANSVALGTDTTGTYVSTVTGTANEIAVTGSGGEASSVTIGLPTNVTIAGDLTVSGTTTTVSSTTVSIADPVFVLGQNASDDNKDRGVEFKYNDGSAKVGWFGYDDSDAKFKYIANATNTSEVFSGTLGNVAFGSIDGTLTTASQTAITGVGTITTGAWQGTAVGATYGGTGLDTSSSTGVAIVSGGTWSVDAELNVAQGGTGLASLASEALMVGNGTGNMTPLTIGSNGHVLQVTGGSPTWGTLDGGTF